MTFFSGNIYCVPCAMFRFVDDDGKYVDTHKCIPGAITITFGEMVENHARMEQIGHNIDEGFSCSEIRKMSRKLNKIGISNKIINLGDYIDEEVDEASVLIIRNGVDLLGNGGDANRVLRECTKGEWSWDKKAFIYGRVVNKKARWNVCMADFEQTPEYENGKGSVVDFRQLPILSKIRTVLPKYLGRKANNLLAEGNYYYNTNDCGIGFHGDSERKIVIGVKLGVSIPLHYQWYHKNKPVGKRCTLNFGHGDMYVMSEKATGNDWKKSSQYTLRHAAGCKKYTT